jgi:hypothetical protein
MVRGLALPVCNEVSVFAKNPQATASHLTTHPFQYFSIHSESIIVTKKEIKMKFETAMNTVHSLAGRKAIARNSLFGAISSLRTVVTQFEGMSKSISLLTEKGYGMRAEAIRNSTRYLALEKEIEERASRAQGIYAMASASFDITPEFEPGVPKHLSSDQLAQIAEFSGMSVQQVVELRNKADTRKYNSEMESASMTQCFFWAAEAEEDPEVKAESVLKALNQTVNFIACWSNPDFAELGILKHDIQILETIAAREIDKEEAEGRLGIKTDGTGSSSNYQRQEEEASE